MRRVLWGIVFVFFAFSVKGCDHDPNPMYYQLVGNGVIQKDSKGALYVYLPMPSEGFEVSFNKYVFQNQKWQLAKTYTFSEGEAVKLLSDYAEPVSYCMIDYHAACILNDNSAIQMEFEKEKLTLKENNSTTSIPLPKAQDIALQIGYNQNGVLIYYFPFYEYYSAWDKKSFLAILEVPNTSQNQTPRQHALIYVHLQDDGSHLIQKVQDFDYAMRYVTFHIARFMLDGSVRMCLSGEAELEKVCVANENGKFVAKKIFGGLYPESFRSHFYDAIKATTSPFYLKDSGSYTFDEKGNMHLFYNKPEDVVNGNYTYFWYGYFTKENPTTPLFEQKVYWK